MDVEGICKLLKDYKERFYAITRSNQDEAYWYYTDTFKVPWIEDPKTVSRTGAGAEIIDEPVEQISAANLIAFRPPLKPTQQAEDSASNVSSFANDTLIRRAMKVNPNPKKENLKNKFLLGESWIHPIHNPQWVRKPFDRTGLPVFFMIPDPRIIFASPNEDENGIPEHVIVFYQRMPWMVKAKYPAWTNPKHKDPEASTEEGKTVDWLEYWDKDIRYFAADEEAIFDPEISPNPYGFVPFVHKVGGFGKSSPTGKPEDLVVSRLWKYRDLLNRDASITSDIDSSIHLFAHSPIIITPPEGGSIGKFKLEWKPGHAIENPNRLEITRAVDAMPKSDVFAWHDRVKMDLGRKTPSVLSGAPQGETGRLQDISYSTAMRKWEGIVAGDEDQWATAIGMALRMCDQFPSLMPDGLSHKDIGKNYVVEIELRADDPQDTQRKSADGDYKQQAGIISWKTNLVKYQGFTSKDADDEMDDATIDTLMQDPITLRLMALQNAREKGMEQEYLALEAEAQGGGQGGIGSQGGEPRNRNIKTAQGREQVDLSGEKKPGRMPPR